MAETRWNDLAATMQDLIAVGSGLAHGRLKAIYGDTL
jgi:hypothetical protein